MSTSDSSTVPGRLCSDNCTVQQSSWT